MSSACAHCNIKFLAFAKSLSVGSHASVHQPFSIGEKGIDRAARQAALGLVCAARAISIYLSRNSAAYVIPGARARKNDTLFPST